MVKIIKSNFKHALRNAIKIILIILQGDSEAFILSLLTSDTGSKGILYTKFLDESFSSLFLE